MRNQSKFMEHDERANKTMTNIPENNSLYHESHSVLEGVSQPDRQNPTNRPLNDGSTLMGIISGTNEGYF